MSRVEDKDINIDNHPEAKDALPPADDKMILENMEYPVLSLRDIVVFRKIRHRCSSAGACRLKPRKPPISLGRRWRF